MSYETGVRIVNLEPTDRVGRTEYCDHDELVRKVTGLDPASADLKEKLFREISAKSKIDPKNRQCLKVC